MERMEAPRGKKERRAAAAPAIRQIGLPSNRIMSNGYWQEGERKEAEEWQRDVLLLLHKFATEPAWCCEREGPLLNALHVFTYVAIRGKVGAKRKKEKNA